MWSAQCTLVTTSWVKRDIIDLCIFRWMYSINSCLPHLKIPFLLSSWFGHQLTGYQQLIRRDVTSVLFMLAKQQEKIPVSILAKHLNILLIYIGHNLRNKVQLKRSIGRSIWHSDLQGQVSSQWYQWVQAKSVLLLRTYFGRRELWKSLRRRVGQEVIVDAITREQGGAHKWNILCSNIQLPALLALRLEPEKCFDFNGTNISLKEWIYMCIAKV